MFSARLTAFSLLLITSVWIVTLGQDNNNEFNIVSFQVVNATSESNSTPPEFNVKAYTDVRFECIVNGSSTPEVRAKYTIKSTNITDVLYRNSSGHEETIRKFVAKNISCEDSGIYFCETGNDSQILDETEIKVNVFCKPELYTTNVTWLEPQKLRLKLTFLTYPSITSIVFTRNGVDINDSVVIAKNNTQCNTTTKAALFYTAKVLCLDVSSLVETDNLSLTVFNTEGCLHYMVPTSNEGKNVTPSPPARCSPPPQTSPSPQSSRNPQPTFTPTAGPETQSNGTVIIVVITIVITLVVIIVLVSSIFIYRKFKGKRNAAEKKHTRREGKGDPQNDGRFVSKEGLVYVTVDLPKKRPSAAVNRKDGVDYVRVDFNKTGTITALGDAEVDGQGESCL